MTFSIQNIPGTYCSISLSFEEAAENTPQKLKKLGQLSDYFQIHALYERNQDFINTQVLKELHAHGFGFVDTTDAFPDTSLDTSADVLFKQAVECFTSEKFTGVLQWTRDFDLEAHDRFLSSPEGDWYPANVPAPLKEYDVLVAKLTPQEQHDIQDIGYIVSPCVEISFNYK